MKNELYTTAIVRIGAMVIIAGVLLLIIITMTKSVYDYNNDVQMRWCLQRYYSYEYCKERFGNNQ